MSEIYASSGRTFMTSNQIRKLKKQMKKSFKKADKLRKQIEKLEEKEQQQADNFLDEQLKNL